MTYFNSAEEPSAPGAGFIDKLTSMVQGASEKSSFLATVEEDQGLWSMGKKSIQNLHDKASGAVSKVQELTISRQRWAMFFLALGMGLLLLMTSFSFLPLIVLAPQKFAMMFTLGSI